MSFPPRYFFPPFSEAQVLGKSNARIAADMGLSMQMKLALTSTLVPKTQHLTRPFTLRRHLF